ncbi:MAG: NIPSNAP family protein [Rhodospirillales bacterium]
MIHQLRIYEFFPNNKTAFLDRFRDHAARLMRKHGFDIVKMWTTEQAGRLEFVYLLAWPDRAALDAAWASFMADAEWQEIKRVTAAEHGDMVGAIEDRILQPV